MAKVTMIPAKTRKFAPIDEEIKPKTKVAAYCRVSTDTDEQATSYEAQVEHYTEYIKKNPEWEFAGIYADDGISGTNTKKRDEFNRMIEDCMSGKIEMIITKSISRFARNTLDCLQYIRQLKEKGVPVYFEKENINTMDAKGELLLTIMASLAQQESQSLSQNVRLGLQFRYQAGKVQVNFKRFLGYTKDDDGNLIIDENEAVVVKRIYREYLEGKSLQDICYSLMDDGILTGAGNKIWRVSTVRKILTNEKYIGDALLQKTITTDFLEKKRVVNKGIAPQYYVEGNHEAIISKEIFMRVQEELYRRSNMTSGPNGEKKRMYSGKYALSNLCVCEQCGDIYRRVAWRNRGKCYNVWRCCSRVNGGPDRCNAPTVLEENLENVLVKSINEVLGKKSKVTRWLSNIIKDSSYGDCLGRQSEIDERLARLQQELVEKAASKQNYDDIVDEVLELRARRQELFEEQTVNNGRQRMKEELIEFLEEQTAEITEYDDALVRKLIEQVLIHENGTFTVKFKSGIKIDVE